MGLGESQGFDGADAFGTGGLAGVVYLAVAVGVAALGFVDPEGFGRGVFHGAVVLSFALVIPDPAVLCRRFAVGGELGLVVDRAGGVVVLDPAQAAHVTYVHVQALEADAGGDDAVELVGPHLGVEQAVLQAGQVDDAGLAASNGAVALQRRKVAPDRGGEKVTLSSEYSFSAHHQRPMKLHQNRHCCENTRHKINWKQIKEIFWQCLRKDISLSLRGLRHRTHHPRSKHTPK